MLAWVEGERDGGEWVPAVATRWDRHHVFVQVDDDRVRLGLWLSPQDVRRKTEP